jgi:hypothetical protein
MLVSTIGFRFGRIEVNPRPAVRNRYSGERQTYPSACIHRNVLAAFLKADRIGGWFYCPETGTFIETVTDWDPPFPTAEQLERARKHSAVGLG